MLHYMHGDLDLKGNNWGDDVSENGGKDATDCKMDQYEE